MKREIQLGRIILDGYKNSLLVTIDIELKQKLEGCALSICGNIWNTPRTDCIECGQIADTLKTAMTNGNLVKMFYDPSKIDELLKIWDKWHLNDTKPGCTHQEQIKDEIIKHIDRSCFSADNYDAILTIKEFDKCPECGYKYGNAWKFRQLPEDVIKFCEDLIKNPI